MLLAATPIVRAEKQQRARVTLQIWVLAAARIVHAEIRS
jgi:hypothetical protein